MKARAPRILMLGTAPEGRGGVAAPVSVLQAGGLFERVTVVPNAVPLPRLAGGRIEAGRLLFLGRLEEAKGVAELLDAAALLAPRFRALRLVLAGTGDVDTWRRAAVFCLPSHAEGLPMSLLEALASGCASVASAVGGIPEALKDGENGLLVPPRDANALAAALARVLADPALRARPGSSARTTVEQHYSTDTICGRLAAIHNDLAGTR